MMRERHSSIGMFDLFKGMCVILIVFGHTITSLSNMDTRWLFTKAITLFNFPLASLLMPAFFMVSGFGFRKRSTKQCLLYLINTLGKYYLYTTVGITLFRFSVRAVITHSLEAAFYETLPVLGGYLLGLPDYVDFGSFYCLGCAPMWYFPALSIAWFLCNLIIQNVPERHQWAAVLAVVLLGWHLGNYVLNIFSFPQGMIAAGYLYLGYMLKKSKFFSNSLKRNHIFFAIAGVFAYLCILILFGMDEMSPGIWQLGPTSIFLDGYVAAIFLHVFLSLNRFTGKITNAIRRLGRNSLYIIIFHAVEIPSIPWYLISQKFADEPDITCWLIFILRWLFISLCMICMQFLHTHKKITAAKAQESTLSPKESKRQ